MNNELMVTEGGALSTDLMDRFQSEAGGGFEDVSSEDTALPFIVLLQALSPQLDESNASYIEDAKAGMFVNTVTGEVFKELQVIPCAFAFKVIERQPRPLGFGFVQRHNREDVVDVEIHKGEKGEHIRADNGNWLIDTAYHYVLVISDGIPFPAVMSLKSTQLRKSKQWLGKMKSLKMRGQENRIFTPPSYSSVYKITSGKESNNQGKSWFGLIIERLGYVQDDSILSLAAEFSATAVERKLASEDVVEKVAEKADDDHKNF